MAYRSTIDGISAEYHSIIEPKVKVPITPMLTHCRYFSFFIITTRPVIGLHSCFHVCGFPQGFIAFNFGYFTWKSIWWVVCSRYLERHLSIPNYYIFLPLHYRTSLAKCIYMCYYKKSQVVKYDMCFDKVFNIISNLLRQWKLRQPMSRQTLGHKEID